MSCSNLTFIGGITTEQGILLGLIIVLIAALVIMPIFTNRRKQKSIDTLHGSLRVGDKIMTIGGIIGVVTEIKQTSPVDKEITIETGGEGSKTALTLDIKALYTVMTPIAPAVTDDKSASDADVFSDAPVTESVPVKDEPVEFAEPAKVESSGSAKVAPVADAAPAADEKTETAATTDEAPADKPAAKPAAKKPSSPSAAKKPIASAAKKPNSTKK
ncbi:MAG: preprotein translocase subunit YajC [Clostridiales bacterium]|jgi:preprotein translocase subunit YajC|nr:preprotein translocase subunit YajC [Clostridiales bacterium]